MLNQWSDGLGGDERGELQQSEAEAALQQPGRETSPRCGTRVQSRASRRWRGLSTHGKHEMHERRLSSTHLATWQIGAEATFATR